MNARRIVLSELRDYLLLIAVGTALSALNFLNKRFDAADFFQAAMLTSVMWILLWKGNSYLSDLIDRRISWIKFPFRRFLAGLVAMVLYTALAIYALNSLYQGYAVQLRMTFIVSIVITVIISLFMHGRSFLINWKEKIVESEKYQREMEAARYEALKNQVSPHFLFNSLNVLINLVYEDKAKASVFIRQLADVYRYVLDSKSKEVVPLAEELSFLNSYLFLQQIRFGRKLQVSSDSGADNLYVVPLALQMLIENAIKHNVVSEEDPLKVTITFDGEMIVVQNNLQRKTSRSLSSTGFGLENITRRYELLGKGRVEVTSDENYFRVRIPVFKGDTVSANQK